MEFRIPKDQIAAFNKHHHDLHRRSFEFTAEELDRRSVKVDDLIDRIAQFQVAIPSWALGTGGTRFGRFSIAGEPGSLEEKISDVGILHDLTKSAGAISLHIPWDVPENAEKIRAFAAARGIVFDAVNSNTFQDQADQEYSYKFGSLCHPDAAVRDQAIRHTIEVIRTGQALGSKSITVWLADGSSFPGQLNFRNALINTRDSLKAIYKEMPPDWKMYIEYKPYEPNFYSMVIPDWGTSYILSSECGERAHCLVDLGHHLPNTNIEQIVSTLRTLGKLGGFHFNDSKYGDDDLTVGSIKPYQLFLIFSELLDQSTENNSFSDLAWMIDASHNLKDPLEDLLQSLDAILLALARASIVNRPQLQSCQDELDVIGAQEVLQDAFRTDLRPIIREARRRSGGCLFPVELYRSMDIRNLLAKERGSNSTATGL